MPFSYNFFNAEISEFFNQTTFDEQVLDIGAGAGKYSRFFPKCLIDAVEAFEPYIKEFDLARKYRAIKVCNALDLDIKALPHKTFIFGDVLEHMKVGDAQRILSDIVSCGKRCFVAVPYCYVQDETHDIVIRNHFEFHEQADLTPAIVKERYPYLDLLFGNELIGYYASNNYRELKA